MRFGVTDRPPVRRWPDAPSAGRRPRHPTHRRPSGRGYARWTGSHVLVAPGSPELLYGFRCGSILEGTRTVHATVMENPLKEARDTPWTQESRTEVGPVTR